MNELEQKRVIANNLRALINASGKSQKEIADAIGESPQVLNSWVQAVSMPGIWKVQKLADFFGIPKSQIIDEQTNEPYSIEKAHLISRIIADDVLCDAIKRYFDLPDQKRSHVLDLIDMLSES